ncbi:hypothetical protein AXX17_ATUG04990 [Arabidopsis thaliana]|uniref:Transmembrane protein n=1 Tax=Arabidopsis thaliana TaxID=3702 RepID=A0A178U544_ARATH|nr:hypothetical protein AXX17_ATUG04990 [Arabidopsis thaliana]
MRGLLLLILCFYLFSGLGFKSTFCSVRVVEEIGAGRLLLEAVVYFMLLSGGRRCLTVMEASSVAPSLCVPACVTTKADLWRVAEVSLRLRQV